MSIKNKLKVVDLFAGAGGFGLGFQMADSAFELICSLEVDNWAVETLKANNFENQNIIHKDIREFRSKEDILSVCPSKPDVIIGGPPCQGFSIAGPVKDPKDPRNSLFKNYAQWVQVLEPKVFVMENVKGLLTGRNEKGERVIDIIQTTFENIGYTIKIWKLNAANYGVPQHRERVFIVGTYSGVEITEPPITHYLPSEKNKLNGKAINLKPAINVISAIGDLPELGAGQGEEISSFGDLPNTDFQKESRAGADKLYNHVTMAHTGRLVRRYEQILKGCSLEDIPEDIKVRKRNGNGEISTKEYNSNYRHLKPDMISYTVPASFYSNFVHPNQPRNITSREAARLQSFPDSYIFKGKRTQISSKLLKQQGKENENFLSQYNQIGNAVPPLLAKAIAKQLYRFFTDKFNERT